jgi:hypothetical protein
VKEGETREGHDELAIDPSYMELRGKNWRRWELRSSEPMRREWMRRKLIRE